MHYCRRIEGLSIFVKDKKINVFEDYEIKGIYSVNYIRNYDR